jgi:hypothetical protein
MAEGSAAFFDLLDPGTPGLDQVVTAAEAGQFDRAQGAYLQYHRDREPPVLHWGEAGEERREAQMASFNFLIEPPPVIGWRDRDKVRPCVHTGTGFSFTRTEGALPTPYTVVDLANMVLENQVFLPVHRADGPQDLGPGWDWEHVPPIEGQRWPMSLSYQYFLKPLAFSYWLTGDERYVAKLVKIIMHYINYVDDRAEWMWLPDMQLARNYLQLLPFVLSWDGLEPGDLCTWLQWMATTNADSMEAVVSKPGNQLLFNGLGLLWQGVGMPEFKRAALWRERGLEHIGGYFAEGAFYPDGSTTENSFGYVIGASASGLEVLQLVTGNGYPYPPHIEEAMQKRADFLADLRKPDGLCPCTGDGQRRSPDSYLKRMQEYRDKRDLEFVCAGGMRGDDPERTSAWYPWMGVGIMRGGWDNQANYLYFDVGPLGEVHAHEGKLAVDVVAFGRSLIEDKGVHSYAREPDDMRWYQFLGHTVGHSTVTVDGLSQMRLVTGPGRVDEPLDNIWSSTDVCDYLEGCYEEGWGNGDFTEPMRSVYAQEAYTGEIDTSIVHRRSVLFVKGVNGASEYWIVTDWLTGTGDHEYEQLWHFIPLETVLDTATSTVRTVTEGQPNLALIPAITTQIEAEVVEGRDGEKRQGWYCAGSSPVPAPCAVYQQRRAPPALFQTVVWPQRAGDEAVPMVESIDDKGGVRVSLPDGREDIYAAPLTAGEVNFGDAAFDGRAALIRLDAHKKPWSWQVIDGSRIEWQGEAL